MSFWNDETRAKAKTMYLAGDSAGEISRHFRGAVSRNAVIGALTRMGVTRSPELAAQNVKRNSPRPAPVVRPVQVARPGPVAARIVEPAIASSTPAATVSTWKPFAPRPFFDRQPGQCAWPIGDGAAMLACCEPVDRAGPSDVRQWCAHHRGIGTVKLKVVARQPKPALAERAAAMRAWA